MPKRFTITDLCHCLRGGIQPVPTGSGEPLPARHSLACPTHLMLACAIPLSATSPTQSLLPSYVAHWVLMACLSTLPSPRGACKPMSCASSFPTRGLAGPTPTAKSLASLPLLPGALPDLPCHPRPCQASPTLHPSWPPPTWPPASFHEQRLLVGARGTTLELEEKAVHLWWKEPELLDMRAAAASLASFHPSCWVLPHLALWFPSLQPAASDHIKKLVVRQVENKVRCHFQPSPARPFAFSAVLGLRGVAKVPRQGGNELLGLLPAAVPPPPPWCSKREGRWIFQGYCFLRSPAACCPGAHWISSSQTREREREREREKEHKRKSKKERGRERKKERDKERKRKKERKRNRKEGGECGVCEREKEREKKRKSKQERGRERKKERKRKKK
ncbi:Genetic suppressor element 1, partial [Ophiophagus hannah]